MVSYVADEIPKPTLNKYVHYKGKPEVSNVLYSRLIETYSNSATKSKGYKSVPETVPTDMKPYKVDGDKDWKISQLNSIDFFGDKSVLVYQKTKRNPTSQDKPSDIYKIQIQYLDYSADNLEMATGKYLHKNTSGSASADCKWDTIRESNSNFLFKYTKGGKISHLMATQVGQNKSKTPEHFYVCATQAIPEVTKKSPNNVLWCQIWKWGSGRMASVKIIDMNDVGDTKPMFTNFEGYLNNQTLQPNTLLYPENGTDKVKSKTLYMNNSESEFWQNKNPIIYNH